MWALFKRGYEVCRLCSVNRMLLFAAFSNFSLISLNRTVKYKSKDCEAHGLMDKLILRESGSLLREKFLRK